jgi:hypothetical protein
MTTWDVITAQANDPKVAALLADGWEPFGMSTAVVPGDIGEKPIVLVILGLRKIKSSIVLPDWRAST